MFLFNIFLLNKSEAQIVSKPIDLNLTPDGVLDKVVDSRGREYKLNELWINAPINSNNPSQLISCSTTSYFNLYFESGSGFENTSNPIHNQRRAVLCKVFQDIANFINSPLTTTGKKVNIWVRNINNVYTNPNGILGLASGFYVFPRYQMPGGVVDNEIWKTIHLGQDSFAGSRVPLDSSSPADNIFFYHGMVTFNFNDTATPPIPNTNLITWNTNLTTTSMTINQFDLYTAALHEITHALGFNSLIDADGKSKLDALNIKYFSRYDKLLKTNNSNNSLLTDSTGISMYEQLFNTNLTPSILSPNNQNCISNITNCSDAIKFVGSNFTIPVYTPNCFDNISSLSHFEDSHYPNCNVPNNNDNYFLMCNSGSSGIIRRFLKQEERAALCDIGYSVKSIFGTNTIYNGYFNYGGAVCPGITVSGANDGLNASGIYTFTGNENSNITISGASILANDINATSFEGLQDLTVTSANLASLSATSGNSSTNIIFNSLVNGVHLFRYVPVNGAQRGNFTYIYVLVRPVINNPICNVANTNCNLIRNGNFEQNDSYLTAAENFQFSRLCNWEKAGVFSPNYMLANTVLYDFNNEFTVIGTSSNVPCNNYGNQSDKINNNKGYAAINFQVDETGKVFYSSILAQTLATPLLPNTTYQLNFDVSIADYARNRYLNFQALVSAVAPSNITGLVIPDSISNQGVLLSSPTVSSINDGWETISFTFTTTSTQTTLQYLYLGALKNTQTAVGTNPVVALNEMYNGCLRKSQIVGAYETIAFYYLDNVSLIALTGTFNLPTSINCSNTTISNLQTLITGFPSNGVFTGFGVELSNTGVYSFNPVLSGTVRIAVTYSYISGGCSQSIIRYVDVLSPSIVPIFATIPTICKNGAFTLPIISLNGISGTWSPAFNNQNTTTYTFTPTANSCGIATTRTITISNTLAVLPTFATIPAICYGATLSLPTTSNNAISGTWSPAINNTQTTTYTFTPNNGLCASIRLFTVVVNSPTIEITGSNFACIGVANTYTASLSGGIWSLSNTSIGTIGSTVGKLIATTAGTTNIIYTLTTGTCTITSTLLVTVFDPNIAPIFSFPTTICLGAVPPVLPNISDNGILGNWAPTIIDNTISATYVFKPTNLCSPNSTVVVSLPNNSNLIANNDSFNIPFSTSSQISPNILLNDTFNGVLLTTNYLGLTTNFSSTPTYGITANADGTLNIPANLDIGTYIVKFVLRKNCILSNSAAITINIFPLPANNIIVAPKRFSIHELCYKPYAYTTTQSIFTDVTIGGVPASAGSVSITTISAPAGFSINPNGTVNIPAGALPETNFEIGLTLCPIGSNVDCVVNVPLYIYINSTLRTYNDLYSYGNANGWLWNSSNSNFRNVIYNDQYSSNCDLLAANNWLPAIAGTNVTFQSGAFVPPNLFFTIDSQGTIQKTNVLFTDLGSYNFVYTICDKNYPTVCSNGIGWVSVLSGARPSKNIDGFVKNEENDISDLEKIVIYPNPSEGIFNLSFSGKINNEVKLTVTNIIGQILFEKKAFEVTNFELDLSRYTSGTYILKISNEEKTINRKLILK